MPLEVVYDPLLRKTRTQDVAVVSADIDHTLIQNRGGIPHTGLDGHAISEENPHDVTAEQVGIDINLLHTFSRNIDYALSPYNPPKYNTVIFCDTNNGAITINLPAGVAGRNYKIANCGINGLNVTIDPHGDEQIYGNGMGVAVTLVDGNILDLHYNATRGWW